MKKIALLLLSSLFIFSCSKNKKDDEQIKPTPNTINSIDNSGERYFPLAVNNSWTLKGSKTENTLKVKSVNTINKTEYYEMTSSQDPSNAYNYRFQNGKYYAHIKTGPVDFEYCFLDENVKLNDTWIGGSYKLAYGYFDFKTTYKLAVDGVYSELSVNGTIYKDVIQIRTDTYTQYIFAGGFEDDDSETLFSTQTAYYAKGVGPIKQISDFEEGNSDLIDYTIVK